MDFIKEKIYKLLNVVLDENSDNLIDPDEWIKHNLMSYETAKNVVRSIRKYYNLPINPGEVCIAAGIHDIGRALNKEQVFHEIRGSLFVEKNKLGNSYDALSNTRISQMILSHGLVYEEYMDEYNEEFKIEFKDFVGDGVILIPRTWQEMIVAYSDFNYTGDIGGYKNRLEESLRRKKKGKYKSESEVRAAERGLERVYKLCENVERLMEGKLSEYEIRRYGFLV